MHPGSSFTLLRCAPCVGPSCRRLFALGAPFTFENYGYSKLLGVL